MPTAATESRLFDAIANALGTIGTPPSSWNSTPTQPVVDGTPNDAVEGLTQPQVFFQFFRTDPAREGAGMTKHRYRIQFIVWMCASDTKKLLAVKSDVMRAIFAAESGISATFGQPCWPDAFQYHTDMRAAGNMVGSLIVWTEVEMDHSAP